MARRGERGSPVVRTEGLLVEKVDDETVILDTATHEVHCLSPFAAVVYTNCDGSNSVAELARLAGSRLDKPISEEQVEAALVQLEERGLMVALSQGISRRALVRKTALATAAITAAPLVTSIVTPAHAQLISPTPGCPRAVCSSQSEGDKFCNELGCPPIDDPDGPRDSCECELCCILLDQGRVASCPYDCNGTTPVNPPPCPPGSSPSNPGPGGCQDPNKHLDGECIQRPGDTSEPCAP